MAEIVVLPINNREGERRKWSHHQLHSHVHTDMTSCHGAPFLKDFTTSQEHHRLADRPPYTWVFDRDNRSDTYSNYREIKRNLKIK